MKPCIAFYDGKVLFEGDRWPSNGFPLNTYIRLAMQNGKVAWFHIVNPNSMTGQTVPLKECDVPKWVRAWCLIL